jgi:hypothetical protein
MRQPCSIDRTAHGSTLTLSASICPLRGALLLIASIAFVAPGIAAAEDPLGLYIGGALGQATLRTGHVPYLQSLLGTSPAAISEHDTGWKALIGSRPLQFERNTSALLRMARIRTCFRSV